MHLIDQTSDFNGQHLYKLDQRGLMPEFVKDASVDAIYGSSDLPIGAYAEPGLKQFPVHTKAATWVSYAFLLDNRDELGQRFEPTKNRIKMAASFHDISEDLEKLEDGLTKVAASEEPIFALSLTLPNGRKIQKYPLTNESEVKSAADYLVKHKSEIPYEYRSQMAEKILEQDRGYLKDELYQEVEKQAGFGWCAPSEVSKALMDRAILLQDKDKGAAEELRKAAFDCMEHVQEIIDPQHLRRVAGLLDKVDREYGFNHYYGPEFKSPEESLFSLSVKTASDYLDSHCQMVTGSVYCKEDLAQVKLAELRDIFGEDFARSVSAGNLLVDTEKLAVEAEALPRPDALLLERLLKAADIHPVTKEASAPTSWLTKEVLQELAQQ